MLNLTKEEFTRRFETREEEPFVLGVEEVEEKEELVTIWLLSEYYRAKAKKTKKKGVDYHVLWG